jgi:hypothetical protein
MDGERFDRWTRRLAASTSRRTVLKTLIAGLAGGIAASAGFRQAFAAVTCPDGRPPCRGRDGLVSCCNECSQCGGAGQGCSGGRCRKPASCANGQCVCPPNTQKCGPACCDPAHGTTCVDGACRCLDGRLPCRDKNGADSCCDGCSTCSTTGRGCRPDACVKPATCNHGECVCPPGREQCGFNCCDPAHGMSCVDGGCQCADGRPACQDSGGQLVCCDGCSSCDGNGRGCRPGACRRPQSCTGGQCVCPPGNQLCGATCCDPATGMTCVDGACRCADDRPACQDANGLAVCCNGCSTCNPRAGRCVTDACQHPQTCSGNQCVCPPQLQKCGVHCCDLALGMSCIDGMCRCADGRPACANAKGDSICCDGCSSCAGNGGGCRPGACRKPQHCSGGQCVCPSGLQTCGGDCCDPAKGMTCVDGACHCQDGRPACSDPHGGLVCCNECSTCSDNGHGCQAGACVSPAACRGGQCVCPGDTTDCGTTCCSPANCETCANGSCARTCAACEVCDGRGHCVSACGHGLVCRQGNCVCADGRPPCNGRCCGGCDACTAGNCASACGECQLCDANSCVAAPDGTACDAHDVCTTGDGCLSGACTGGSPVACPEDGDPCTSNVCQRDQGGCVAVPIPGCCSTNADCSTIDPCTPAACANGTCQSASNCGRGSAYCVANPGAAARCVDCLDDSQCGDCRQCGQDGTCGYVPAGNDPKDDCFHGVCDGAGSCVACVTADDCPQRDVCSTPNCTGANACDYIAIPGCCLADADCDDANPCSRDICNLNTNACLYVAVSDCCQDDAECADGDECTVDTCDPTTNTCVSTPVTCGDCERCAVGVCGPVADGDPCGSGGTCQSGVCI